MGRIQYCEHCGHPLEEGSRFCENCGAPVTQKNAQTPEQVFTPRDAGRQEVPRSANRDPQYAGRQEVPRSANRDPQAAGRQEMMRNTDHDPYSGGRQHPYADRPDNMQGRNRQMQRNSGYGHPEDGRGPQRGRNPQDDYRFDPQEQTRRDRYRQENLENDWEQSWSREYEEDEKRFTPIQYVLIGIIAVLILALLTFGIFWAVGRTKSRDAGSRTSGQSEQIQNSTTGTGSDDVITILDGNGQPQSETKVTEQATERPTEKETEKVTEQPTETETETERITEKPTEKQTEVLQIIEPQTEPASDDYILSHSSERQLTDNDVAGMSYDDMQMAINEIYARHGRKFASDSIQSYFNSKSWYQGTVDADNFSDSVFSAVEGQNIQFLLKKMGIQ